MVNAVIFDMDGLLFDTAKIFASAWDYAGEMIGIGKVGYMIKKTMGMSLVMSRDIWIQEFKEKYDEEKFQKYAKMYVQQYYKENKVSVKKGVNPLLKYLKNNNYLLAIASSSFKSDVEKHLIDTDIYNYFDIIVCGDMVNYTKPEPDIYIKVCEMLGKKPEECIALEDSKSGLIAAFRAGCKPIMIPDIWEPDKEIEGMLWKKFNDLNEVRCFFEQNMFLE